MKGKLFRYELSKVLFSFRGLWMIVIFIVLKAILLFILPEIKDSRIALSQNQYDKVLATIEGETTEEKERYIEDTYHQYQAVAAKFTDNMNAYLNGQMSEEEWSSYSKEYREASLYENAYSIFMDKVKQFRALQPYNELPPPAYFYEYGWDSMFTYLSYPDPLFLLLVLILSMQMIAPELSSGAMNLILTTKNGRKPLFFAKLKGLLLLLCPLAVVSTLGEAGILSARFSLTDGHWPIYSITSYSSCLLNLSLTKGLVCVAVIRAAGLILTGLFAWSIMCLLKNASHAAFCSIGFIMIPYLLLPEKEFFIGAWLSGKPVLVSDNPLISAVMPCVLLLFLWLAYRARFCTEKNN